jgi:multiple sugar transport system permease protein
MFRLVATAVVSILVLFFLLPIIWTISTSLKPGNQVFVYPPKLLPAHPQFHNYADIWSQYPLARWFLNSFFITATIVCGQLFTSSLSGFAFAKLRFRGRDRFFLLYLFGLLIPSQVLLVPIFFVVSKLHWVNSAWGLIVPALAGPFGTFLFRQFYLSVSNEYIEAARLDGASTFRIYRSIFVPLSRGLMAAFAAITFLMFWNSYLWPLVLLSTESKYTVTLGLAYIANGPQFQVPWPTVMADAVTIMVPVLLLFALAQRKFVRGIALTGYTGK